MVASSRLLLSSLCFKLNNKLVFSRDLMNDVVKVCDGSIKLSSHIEQAANELLNGGVIALPTDTIYGLAALAQNNKAIQHIYNVKKRDVTKPLAICVSDIEDIYQWGQVTVPYSLLSSLLPGPVTLVFERTPDLNPNLNSGTNLVGIRIPDNEFILRVTELCRSPIALTSANVSQGMSPLDVLEFKNLWSKLTNVYSTGRISESVQSRAGSTIVDLSVCGYYKIIREGSALKNTLTVLHKYKLSCLNNKL